MKKLMMVTLLSMICGFGFAQQPDRKSPKPEDIEKRMEKARTELSLSDEQFDQWKAIHEKYADDMKAAMEAKDREKGKEIREKMGGELEAILTEEQKEKFGEIRERERKRKGPGKG